MEWNWKFSVSQLHSVSLILNKNPDQGNDSTSQSVRRLCPLLHFALLQYNYRQAVYQKYKTKLFSIYTSAIQLDDA
jgi:hypothetical protein